MQRWVFATPVSEDQQRKIIAALEAAYPQSAAENAATGTLCANARDTGKPAFVGLPCRGNRIECAKTGITNYAAACRPEKCRYYTETTENE